MSNYDSNKLIIREFPILLWLFGGLFILVGLSLMQKQATLIGGVILTLIGAFFGLFMAFITTICADRTNRLVTLQQQSLIRNIHREIPFGDIVDFEIETSQSRRGGKTYRMVVALSTGVKVPIHDVFSTGYLDKDKKVRQLNEFIGLQEREPKQLAKHLLLFQKDGVTGGIHWHMETSKHGESPVTRWSSTQFSFPQQFLFIAQKPQVIAGAKSLTSKGGLVGSLVRQIYQQLLNLYGFTEIDTPNLDKAIPLDPPVEPLDPHYATLTSDPNGARQLLNPWIITPLVQWAEQYPMSQKQLPIEGEYGQLVVLFSPQATYVAFFNSATLEQIEAISRLVSELVLAQGLLGSNRR